MIVFKRECCEMVSKCCVEDILDGARGRNRTGTASRWRSVVQCGFTVLLDLSDSGHQPHASACTRKHIFLHNCYTGPTSE